MKLFLLAIFHIGALFALAAAIDAVSATHRSGNYRLHQVELDRKFLAWHSVADNVQGLKSFDRRYRYYD